tara:strand:- start:1106 stop:1723 length:618 start_codon:yes stop_codon:yes gene_type:complete
MYKYVFKRVIDVIASLILLILFSPIIATLILILFITNNGKPFYFQKRPGKNEQIFTIIKFKTMNDKKDKNGMLLKDTYRLTRIGRIIRKTSLDEILQLINVLIGTMSIIGPRPLLIKYLPFYNDDERIRHSVRPGITGLAQISGRNRLDWDNRLKKDIEYVSNLSFYLDLKIFLKSFLIIIAAKNIDIDTSNSEIEDFDIYRQNK